MNKRGFAPIIILIIIGILAVAGGAYYFINKSVPVAPAPTATTNTPPETVTPIANNPTPVTPGALPSTCVDKPGGAPVITLLDNNSGEVGDAFGIRGCNLSGFEGDKNAWIESSQGLKGFLRGGSASTDKILEVKLESKLCQGDNSYSGLPCSAFLTLTPGTYKIYVITPSGKSNEAIFNIYTSIDRRRVGDILGISNALEQYYNKNGKYPPTSNWAALTKTLLDGDFGLVPIPSDPAYDPSTPTKTYIPNDPSAPARTYYYGSDDNGTTFVLGAKLDDVHSSLFESEYGIEGVPAYVKISGITCSKALGEYCLGR